MLTAGWAVAPLTGGLGLPLAGRQAWPALAEDVLDEPMARALVLDDDELQVALVAVDLFAIDNDLLRRAAELVYDQIRIFAPALIVVPTGTATAPQAATLLGLPARHETYSQQVAEQIASAVVYAARSRRPAALGWAHGPGPAMVRLDDVESQRPLAFAGEFTALPAGHGAAVSADYPGVVARFFEKVAPATGWVGLLGAAADQRGPDDPENWGEAWGALAYSTALRAEPHAEVTLGIAARTVALSYQAPTLEQAEARLVLAEEELEQAADPLRQRTAAAEVERARQAVAAAQPGWQGEREIRVLALALGDGALVALPLLPTAAAGRQLRKAVPTGDFTLIAAGVNGLFGVLPATGEVPPEGAEWYTALPFQPDAANQIAAACADAVAAAQAMAAADRTGGETLSEASGDDTLRA